MATVEKDGRRRTNSGVDIGNKDRKGSKEGGGGLHFRFCSKKCSCKTDLQLPASFPLYICECGEIQHRPLLLVTGIAAIKFSFSLGCS